MNENLFPNLEQMLAPLHQGLPTPQTGDWSGNAARQQSFRAYRLSRPARKTDQRQAIYLSDGNRRLPRALL
jgi:hypothetical protein